MPFDVLTSAARAARAELAWWTADGRPDAVAIVPLVLDDDVVAALPFSEAAVARQLSQVSTATLVCSDSRMALKGWSPCATRVAVDVTADLTGAWTWTGALDQEVRKHPPSRLLVDTAIQRREHWWYVPRWVVRLRPTGAAWPVARRGPDDGVLFVADVDAPAACSVAVRDWSADRVRTISLDPTTADLDGVGGPALLFGHDFSVPDQERTSRLALRGELDAGVVTVSGREGRLALPDTRLLRRLRAHYRLERACRAALEAYEASPSEAAT